MKDTFRVFCERENCQSSNTWKKLGIRELEVKPVGQPVKKTYLRLVMITGGDEREAWDICDEHEATEPLLVKRPTLRSLSDGSRSVIT